jgi:hypothetical protein
MSTYCILSHAHTSGLSHPGLFLGDTRSLEDMALCRRRGKGLHMSEGREWHMARTLDLELHRTMAVVLEQWQNVNALQ